VEDFLVFLNLPWYLFCFWFLSKKLASVAPGLITPLLLVSLQTWLNNTTWLVIHCGFLIIFLLPCLDRSSGSKSPLWLSWWGLFHSRNGNGVILSSHPTVALGWSKTCLTSAEEPDERGVGRSCELVRTEEFSGELTRRLWTILAWHQPRNLMREELGGAVS